MKSYCKKNILFILLILLVTILSGCHGSKKLNEFVVPESFDTTKEIEISFWAKNDSNVTQKKIYEDAISSFEEIYPNVKVTMKSYTDYSAIYNDVITNISTQTTPNVCISYPDHVATYLSGDNIVVPLDELINDEKYGLGGSDILFESTKKDEVISKFLSEGYLNGYYYTIPFMRSTEACYINKTYVEKMGYTIPDVLTWDFVWEVCEEAMEKDEAGNFKVNNQKVLIPFIYKSTDNMMIQLLKQKDGGYSAGNGSILIFNDTTKSLLQTIADHAASRCFSTFKISGYPGNFFNAGQCLFAIDSTAGATWLGSDAPLSDIHSDSIVQFETEVKIIPQFDVDNPFMISQGPSLCVFNKEDPQEVLASWLFTQYLLTNDTQIAYSQTEGYIPVTTKAYNSLTYQDYLSRGGEDNQLYYDVKIKASKLLFENTSNTFVTPVFNGSTSLRNAAGDLIEEVVKSARRKEEINDEYYERLYIKVSAANKLDQIEELRDAKANLGELPETSVILLISLVIIWILLITYYGISYYKKKLKNKNNK